MSTKGFTCLAINTERDTIVYAYLLASSIKKNNPNSEFCLIVDKNKSGEVPKKYYKAFDYIVELPYGNTGYNDGFHGSNLWQVFHCTPFDETIHLDYDMIFNKVDVSLLWDQLYDYDLAIPKSALTYRNAIANKETFFEIEKLYNLPQLYGQFIYFKRSSQTAIEWFKMADPVFQNWRETYSAMFADKKPSSFDKNVLVNITTHLLDLENTIGVELNNFYELDNLSQWHWHNDIPANWTQMLNYWYTNDQQFIIENNVISNGIIHYGDEMCINGSIVNVIGS